LDLIEDRASQATVAVEDRLDDQAQRDGGDLTRFADRGEQRHARRGTDVAGGLSVPGLAGPDP
jgi:hypothetical protein